MESKDINKRIELIYITKGLKQKSFANSIDMHPATLTNIVRGRNAPSFKVLAKILEIYTDVNPDWLLLGKEPMNRSQESEFEFNNLDIKLKLQSLENRIKNLEIEIKEIKE